MESMSKIKLSGVVLMMALLASSCGGSSGGGGGGGTSGATLTGTVDTFTAALETEKKTLLVQIKDFLFSTADAAVSDVTVSVGGQTTTTGADGSFTLNNIETGDQIVTFTQGSTSVTYALDDVEEGETHTMDDVVIDETVSTAHTGTWTGTMMMDIFTGSPVEVTFTLTIIAGGNSISGSMVIDEGGFGEVGTFSGTETGSILDARWTNTEPDEEGCILAGPLTGTFDGTTLTGNEPIDTSSCGVHPGDDDPNSHPFTLTKL